MILGLCKVGPVDLCRNVWICIDLQGKYKGESMQMHTKSTHFNKNQLVQVCTAQKA